MEETRAMTSETPNASDDAQWRQRLTPLQYAVMRDKGTEPPFSGEYCHFKQEGRYHCAGCGAELFDSGQKYDSGSGWPSFWQAASAEALRMSDDQSHGMRRVEIQCARCDAHLGHVFDDGPEPTGERYCVNSVSLSFTPRQEA